MLDEDVGLIDLCTCPLAETLFSLDTSRERIFDFKVFDSFIVLSGG